MKIALGVNANNLLAAYKLLVISSLPFSCKCDVSSSFTEVLSVSCIPGNFMKERVVFYYVFSVLCPAISSSFLSDENLQHR